MTSGGAEDRLSGNRQATRGKRWSARPRRRLEFARSCGDSSSEITAPELQRRDIGAATRARDPAVKSAEPRARRGGPQPHAWRAYYTCRITSPNRQPNRRVYGKIRPAARIGIASESAADPGGQRTVSSCADLVDPCRLLTLARGRSAGRTVRFQQPGPEAPPNRTRRGRRTRAARIPRSISALDQINKSNVSRLDVAWTYPVNGNITFNPIVVDGVMYVQGTGNAIVALDAATGKEIWTPRQPGRDRRRAGINYWESADRSDRRLLYLNAGNLTAINAETGETITSFGTNGRVDLRVALWREARNPLQTSNPGRIFENLIIISLPAQGAGYDSTPADVQAYDVRTGKIVWVFHSIPHPGEFGYDTWPEGAYKTAGGVHNWSELTVDAQNGIAFIPFGTARFDFYRRRPPGQQPVRQQPGRARRAHGQAALASAARASRSVGLRPAAGAEAADAPSERPQPSTSSRRRRSSASSSCSIARPASPFSRSKSGRCRSPTCRARRAGRRSRFPTKPAPFARQSFTEKDINPYLPEAEKEMLRQRLRSVQERRSVHAAEPRRARFELPGHNGGANWGSSAVDPTARRVLRRRQEHADADAPRAEQRGAHGGRRARRWTGEPDRHGGAEGTAHGRGQGGGGEGAGALHVAVRLHAQPVERHDGDRAAVVGNHRLRPQHRRDQVACAARRRHARRRSWASSPIPGRTCLAAGRW